MKNTLLLPALITVLMLIACAPESGPAPAEIPVTNAVVENTGNEALGDIVIEATNRAAQSATANPMPVALALFDTSESIRMLMNDKVQANANILWQAVRYVVNSDGVEEDVQPETEADWTRLREAALALIAAGNALLITERDIDTQFPREDYPEYTYTPDEIRTLLNEDTDTWRFFIDRMQFSTQATLDAIEKQDVLGLMDAGATINNACEGCHGTYWYRPLNP